MVCEVIFIQHALVWVGGEGGVGGGGGSDPGRDPAELPSM